MIHALQRGDFHWRELVHERQHDHDKPEQNH
jgi:hypothetical protein